MKNLLLLILVILASCSKPPEQQIYTVKAGKHYSDNHMLIRTNTLEFTFEVNDSWYWDKGLELSKVYGLAFGEPKKNSVRLATRSMGDYVKLYMFCHVNKDIEIIEVGNVGNGTHYCNMGYDGTYFWLYFDGETHRVEVTGLGKGTVCFPYIGGDYTIKHDWAFRIATQ